MAMYSTEFDPIYSPHYPLLTFLQRGSRKCVGTQHSRDGSTPTRLACWTRCTWCSGNQSQAIYPQLRGRVSAPYSYLTATDCLIPHSRRFDVANERLPEFNPVPTAYPLVPVPSMSQHFQQHIQRQRPGSRSGASTPSGEGNVEDPGNDQGSMPGQWHPRPIEELIKNALKDDDDGVLEVLAGVIAGGKKPGRRRGLKRNETA